MKVKPESRGKLKDNVDRQKRGVGKREKHMKKVVKEKKEIDNVSHKLRYPTKDGAAEIKPVLKKAEAACRKEFGQQEKDLKKKHGEYKETESDLLNRTRLAIIDSIHVRKAMWVKEVDRAKSLLSKAEKRLQKDAHFIEELRRKIKRDRERSEKQCNTLRKIIRRRVAVYGNVS